MPYFKLVDEEAPPEALAFAFAFAFEAFDGDFDFGVARAGCLVFPFASCGLERTLIFAALFFVTFFNLVSSSFLFVASEGILYHKA